MSMHLTTWRERVKDADEVAAAFRAQAKDAQRRYIDAVSWNGPTQDTERLRVLHVEALGQWRAARDKARKARDDARRAGCPGLGAFRG